jgi:hypothetical protein
MKRLTVTTVSLLGHPALSFHKDEAQGDFRINPQTECSTNFSSPQQIQGLKIVTDVLPRPTLKHWSTKSLRRQD